MRKTFLSLLLFVLAVTTFFLPAPGHAGPESTTTHAVALTGSPKYPAGFTHFDYVNPDAPKGGTLKMSAIGTFDSLNPFITKGAPASGLGLIYDNLTVQSDDEPFSQYGLLAEKIEIAADRSWAIYHLNPKARFHDGQPVTAEDVVFSFNLVVEQGHPMYRKYYADVRKVEALDEHRVRFDLGTKHNPELALIIGQLFVLPKHYWGNRDFTATTLEIPPGSGPYRIAEFKPGRSITYSRVEDYWAKDLPVNKGRYNFDTIQYDYYRDATVTLQAFIAGEYDFRQENIAKQWATAYKSPAIDDGFVITEEIKNQLNQGMQCFVFNTRRDLFKNRKVRQALSLAFDFEWTNKNLFYGQYKRSTSYFSNSELASSGPPTPEELEILEPFRKQLPPEVFTEAYIPPATDGSGNARRNLRTALKLLKEAGWEVKNKKLTNVKTGQVFKFEILLLDPSFQRIVLPFKQNLARLGVDLTIRLVDTSQYLNLTTEFNYDMFVHTFPQSLSPGNEQRYYWHSESADIPGSSNYAGIKNPAIDALIDLIITAPTREELVNRTKALDRALLWGYYVIPQWHVDSYRVAYWNKFSRPAKTAQIQPRSVQLVGG